MKTAPEEMRTSESNEKAPVDPADLRDRLLSFYDARRRDLPWRDEPDPYRIWVSEIMLQQTRVETVIPYYEDWLRRFPDVEALADADTDEVLKAWEGLGYYARARNLHQAARVVRERHDGELPSEPDDLKSLPGIGDYTAGAVASIAFNVPAAAVDGNVRRVLSRLHDLEDPKPSVLRRHAEALVSPDRPGDFNQALMELGATICTPKTPACAACPLADGCRARALGTQEERPRPKPSKPLPEYDVGTAVLVAADGRVLLSRRPVDGLLGGLWEFPGATADANEPAAEAAARAARERLGVDPGEPDPIGTVAHTFSHRRTRYHAVRFRLASAPAPRPGTDAEWVGPDEIPEYALPVAKQKIAALAAGAGD